MSYKLNKNLTTAVLALFLVLNYANICHAQGIVSLVEEDDAGIEDDIFPQDTAGSGLTNANSADMDVDLPDTLSGDEDFVPLESGLISPVEPFSSEAEPIQAVANDEVENKEVAPVVNEPSGLPVVDAGVVAPSNGLFAAPAEAPTPAKNNEKLGNTVLSKIDDSLFSQMSDIEKQTTLLTLELRREKIRNEIEAIKAQRQKALDEKLAAEEEKKRKEFEWQKEQEAKVLREQQLLKEKEIELEKLKQRKVLNAYMNQMLEQNQKWIEENAILHEKMRKVEEDREKIATDFKAKMDELGTLSNKVVQSSENAKSNHNRTVASLTAQNMQLKKRMEADALAAKNRENNPFALPRAEGDNAQSGDHPTISLSKEYAIMEIIGKGEELVARLINKDGESFIVNQGALLHTGHVVEKISQRYIQFDRQGVKDYLYTAGSALGIEPQKMPGTSNMETDKKQADKKVAEKESSAENKNSPIPSLGRGMFVK